MLDFGSRRYDPYLNHFTQPDSIVPNGVQGYDRYGYTFNNPVKYTNPSGHRPIEGCEEDGTRACHASKKEILDNLGRDADFRAETNRNQCATGNAIHCSYAQNHPYKTAAFIGGGLLLSGAGAATMGATTVTAETAVTTTTVAQATNGFCGGDMCTGEIDELSRFFHSGYRSQVAAETLAKAHNAVTLSQTEAGAELTQIYETSGYNVMRPFTEAASADWAVGASGRVDVILNLPLVHNSIWATIEYHSLLANDVVKTIVIHFIP